MIKVYLDTLVFGLQKFGGVSVVWNELLRRMTKDNSIEITLLDIKQEYVNPDFVSIDKSNCKHLKERNWNLQVLRNISPNLGKIKGTVIFHSTYLRVSNNRNVKNVVTIHDFTHQFFFKGIKKILNTHQKNKAIRKADGIVCISENTKRDLIKLYPDVDQSKIRVIYNAASDDYYRIENPSILDRYQEIEGKSYFIYVGDRFPYKNSAFLYKVLKANPDLHCVLIGGREFSNEEKSSLGSDMKRVHRFTRVPNAELNILYNRAVCMIFPSLYEGFGIPILEAMKAGCPVITFNNSSLPEVLRGTGILLENNDLEGCNRAIRKLMDQEYRNKIISEQLEAAKFFSWERSYEALRDFYQEIINKQ